MKVGIIGLGRMGNALAERALKGGHEVIGYDMNAEVCERARKLGVQIAASVSDLGRVAHVIWFMLPAGDPIDNALRELSPVLKKEMIIVDGGNSYYEDSIRRAHMLAQVGVFYLDCGTSGGIHGREHGFCLMVGGYKPAYEELVPLFTALAAPQGFAHIGPSGAGHYVKMVHNGIEYGLMEAYAEGFQLMREGTFANEHLDLAQITGLWNHGAVIRSFLLELAHDFFKKDQALADISGKVNESGMGKWTIEEAHKHTIRVPVIKAAVDERAWSRETGGNYGTKVVALFRHAFGGHPVKKNNT